MTKVTVSMRAIVAEVLRETAAESAGVRAEFRVGSLPGCHGDPVLLRQVWQNLIGNAVKYSRGREAPVVEIGHDAAAGAYFVRDNGAGFDMQYADKLFGVFERLHSQTEFEGTGIGLASVRRILERHGGRIWAQGSVGEGATFWFSLPG
jgi:light-regulated signal transduction histidine kinase (bacteriophytochrome)